MDDNARIKGKLHFIHIRKGEVIDEWDADNAVVNQGINYGLGAMIGGASAITNWYLGLFSGNYTPQLTDTAASIAANANETTQYAAGARQAFNPAPASGQSITNAAAQASFTFNAATTVYGGFLISSSVINGTSGTLFSAAQFNAFKNVAASDQILVTYTFGMSG
jgi:hypothetical protein